MSQPLQNRTNFYIPGPIGKAFIDEDLISIFTSWLMFLGENKTYKHIALGISVFLKNHLVPSPRYSFPLFLSHVSMKASQGQFILVMAFPQKGK